MYRPSKVEGKEIITWPDYSQMIEELGDKIKATGRSFDNVYGIPRGGLIPAVCLSHKLNIPLIIEESEITKKTLVVDEISDSGKTLKKFKERVGDLYIATLYMEYETQYVPSAYVRVKKCDWLIFPWENNKTE